MSGALTRMVGRGGTPPGSDPSFSSVVLLCGYEGAAFSTGTDSSSFNHTPTEHSPGAGLFATPGKFGAKCYDATGAGGWISYADSADWSFGSGSFTVETWVNFSTAPSSSFHTFIAQYDTNAQRAWSLGVDSNVLTFRRSVDGAATDNVTGAWTPSTGTWYHVAACFDGTTTRVFVDGVLKGSSVTLVTLFNSTATLTLGCALATGAKNTAFRGFMDETRITKGVARYTAAFTAPTGAFPRS